MQIIIDMDGTVCTEEKTFSRSMAKPEWLKINNVKYHQLMMGKPIGDLWIDDRALNFNNNWEQIAEVINSKKKK
jgi:predicted phosphatase